MLGEPSHCWFWSLLVTCRKRGLSVNGSSKIAATLSIAMLAVLGNAHAESNACEATSCELGGKPSRETFESGKVDGAAVWKSDGHANVWFTSTTKTPDNFKVAVCGAASVEAVKFDSGGYKDSEVVAPKGKLSGCDVYSLRTGMRVDGLRVKPKGNSFRMVVRKNDVAQGYSIYLANSVLPAREGFYHFRMK